MSFKRYPKYKDCGADWPRRLPEHWDMRRFQRCVYVAEGQVDPEDPSYSAMPLIAPNYIESGTGRLVELESADDQGAESGKYLCVAGDVVYSKIRPALRKVCIAPENCLCSADMYPLRGHSGLINLFLFWVMLSEEFSAVAVLESQRVAMPKINRESLKAIHFAMPPVTEQAGIAAFLDRETAKIDALVAEQQRLLELLKEKRQAVISHAVTKGLNPDAPTKPSGIEWLGDVPAHWALASVRRIIRTIEQGWSPECDARPAEPGEWGILKAGCVNRGVFADQENKALPGTLEPIPDYEIAVGDVLMSRASGSPELVGSTALVSSTRKRLMLSDKIFRLHPTPNVDSRFLVALFNSRLMRSQIEGAISGADGLANNLPQSSLRREGLDVLAKVFADVVLVAHELLHVEG